MILLAARNASIDSKSGTGISPGSSSMAASCTPQNAARRSTAKTSSSDSAPLITYCRIAAAGYVFFSSAIALKVCNTSSDCSENPTTGIRCGTRMPHELRSRSAWAVHPRVLADVERVKMKAEGPQLAQQRLHNQLRQQLASRSRAGCHASAKGRLRIPSRPGKPCDRQIPLAVCAAARPSKFRNRR